jgi:hypothetical protein
LADGSGAHCGDSPRSFLTFVPNGHSPERVDPRQVAAQQPERIPATNDGVGEGDGTGHRNGGEQRDKDSSDHFSRPSLVGTTR